MRGARSQIVLVGAGHAHLHVLRQARRFTDAGGRLTILSPREFRYSGLAAAVLAGTVAPAANMIRVDRLAQRYGVTHIDGRAIAVDTSARQVRTSSGQTLSYDYLSFNTGSEPRAGDQMLIEAGVKPLENLERIRLSLDIAARDGGAAPRAVVVGAGHSGIEAACALRRRCEDLFGRSHVTLLAGPSPFAWAGPRLRSLLVAALERQGVSVRGDVAEDCLKGGVRLSDGRFVPADLIVWATGLRASPIVSTLGLPCDDRGRLFVRQDLSAERDDRIFAVGDCATITGFKRPMLGVFGVRAASVLSRNLYARLNKAPVADYRPQNIWLSILDLSDGTALALYGQHHWRGFTALGLKRYLDHSFMALFRT